MDLCSVQKCSDPVMLISLPHVILMLFANRIWGVFKKFIAELMFPCESILTGSDERLHPSSTINVYPEL